MVILHIARVLNNSFNGVCIVVPQHIVAQQDKAEVALLNIIDEKIAGVKNQFFLGKMTGLDTLSAPFHNPDIVIFHEVYFKQYLKFSAELRKKKIPYVIIPHGCLTREAQKKKLLKKFMANILLFDKFINGAESIQCLSEGEAGTTRRGSHKFIGTNGVSIPSNRKKDFHKDEVKFVYIGRLEAEIKGLDLMLDAFKLKLEDIKECHASLYIYGPDYKGRYANVEKMITDRKLQDYVFLHKEVSGKEKEEILLDADVFIQTSRSEAMPLGILEALSYGIPCLITEGAALGGMIRKYNAGWVVETSKEAIAEGIVKAVVESKEWLEKSRNAQSSIEKEFAWEKVTEHIILNYKKLIGR